MLKSDLIFRNPLRLICQDTEDTLPPGGFGALLARAGLGKTALLVQLALDSLIQDRNVLHISLGDPVKKVCLWYEEVFRNISAQYGIRQADRLWGEILPHRLIMTFNVDSFSVPKLEERLTDLREQKIFCPRIILIDGLSFDENIRTSLSALKTLAKDQAMSVWFTVRIHRHQAPGPDGLPLPISGIADLFEAILQLQPEEKGIRLAPLKGGAAQPSPLLLDTSTMLVKIEK
jgi:hypothetical protein